MTSIKWRFGGQRNFFWFDEYIQIVASDKATYRKVYGFDFEFKNMKKDYCHNEFFGQKEFDSLAKVIGKKSTADPKFLNKIAKITVAKSRKLVAFSKKISKKQYAQTSELLPDFASMITKVIEFEPVVNLIFFVEQYLEKYGKIILQKKIQQQKLVEEYFSILSNPSQEIEIMREQKEILKLAMLENPESQIYKHLNEFAWLPTDDANTEPWTEIDIKQRIDFLKNQNPSKRLQRIEQMKKENLLKRKNIEDVLHFSAKEKFVFHLIRKFVFLRTFRAEAYIKAMENVR